MKLLHKQETLNRHRRVSDELDHTSPNMSYYSHRSDQELNIGRKLKRKAQMRAEGIRRTAWLQRFGFIVVVIIVFVVAIRALNLSSNAIIKLGSTNSIGLFQQNQTRYQIEAQKILANSIWDHNKITLNTDQLSNDLISHFPEITSVNVDLPFLSNRPIVYVQVAEPAIILNDSHGSYILDSNGRVLASTLDSTTYASLDLPEVTDQSGLVLERNRQALPTSDVSFIQTIIAQLNARNFKVYSMTLPPAASELDVQIVDQPYFIKFNLENDDPRQQVGTYIATQAYLTSQHITPAHYIDVRVDGRAYYE